uniref:Uncharacterized protein n=1 Tax=Amphimedon queenslandica TaxID=400682 RepID=A0A1X7US17_AMPQE
DKTKCVVKNDHCSSSLIVSIKLSIIKLKTSIPKQDDIIFTYLEPCKTDIVKGDNGNLFTTLVMKNFKEGGVIF